LIRSLNRQLAGEKDFPVVAKLLGAAIGKLGVDFPSLLYSTVSGQLNSTKVLTSLRATAMRFCDANASAVRKLAAP
jgi:hypothetical protein